MAWFHSPNSNTVFRRGTQDEGISVLRGTLTLPLGPNLLSIHRTALKVRPQACLAAVLLQHGSLCTRMRGCAAGLWSPGTNGRQLIQEHAMLIVSFPDPSVRCCTGKYCVYQCLEKCRTHRGQASHGGTGKRETLPQPRHAMQPLSRDGNPSSSETSSDSDIASALRQIDFLFVHTYSCLDGFCISAL